MKIIGVIIEANPFHNGHQYLINEIKVANPDSLLICVCSGYFTMRGEIASIPKYEKTKVLLDSGFDIVIDLPLYCSLNSSKKFAENSLCLLNKAKITDLYFGLEKNSTKELYDIINYEKKEDFKSLLLQNLHSEISYKKAYAKTILNLSNNQNLYELALLPNATLALDYVRAIDSNYHNITPHSIKRIGEDDNSIKLQDFPSGTALRKALSDNIDIKDYINYDSSILINLNNSYNLLNHYIKSLILKDAKEYKDIHLINEGIENYIVNNIDINLNYEDIINKLSNKKYTKSRIKRTVLSMILQLPKEINEDIPLRVLGFSKKGELYLKNLKEHQIFTSIKNINSYYYKCELSACKLYDILTKSNSTINEFKFPIKGGQNE